MHSYSYSNYNPYLSQTLTPTTTSHSSPNTRRYFPSASNVSAVAPLYTLKSGPEFQKITYQSEEDLRWVKMREERAQRGRGYGENPFHRPHLVQGGHWRGKGSLGGFGVGSEDKERNPEIVTYEPQLKPAEARLVSQVFNTSKYYQNIRNNSEKGQNSENSFNPQKAAQQLISSVLSKKSSKGVSNVPPMLTSSVKRVQSQPAYYENYSQYRPDSSVRTPVPVESMSKLQNSKKASQKYPMASELEQLIDIDEEDQPEDPMGRNLPSFNMKGMFKKEPFQQKQSFGRVESRYEPRDANPMSGKYPETVVYQGRRFYLQNVANNRSFL